MSRIRKTMMLICTAGIVSSGLLAISSFISSGLYVDKTWYGVIGVVVQTLFLITLDREE